MYIRVYMYMLYSTYVLLVSLVQSLCFLSFTMLLFVRVFPPVVLVSLIHCIVCSCFMYLLSTFLLYVFISFVLYSRISLIFLSFSVSFILHFFSSLFHLSLYAISLFRSFLLRFVRYFCIFFPSLHRLLIRSFFLALFW